MAHEPVGRLLMLKRPVTAHQRKNSREDVSDHRRQRIISCKYCASKVPSTTRISEYPLFCTHLSGSGANQ